MDVMQRKVHVQPPNQHFSLSAKINGTQRRAPASPGDHEVNSSKNQLAREHLQTDFGTLNVIVTLSSDPPP